MTTKTDCIAILKNENGNYFLEIPQELCDHLGLSEDIEFDIVIYENGIELKNVN